MSWGVMATLFGTFPLALKVGKSQNLLALKFLPFWN